MDNIIKQFIENVVNANIIKVEALSGGMISHVIKVTLDNHQTLVAKLSDTDHDLTIEAYMLQYLKDHSQLPIPRVIHATPQIMLLDYINGTTGLNTATQGELGKLLVQLHQVTATQFGLERDTLIGPIHQPNPLSDSWISFYREQRLLYMAKIALQSGYLPQEMYQRIQSFAESVDKFLIEPEAPALIHGDMWTTNILVKQNQIVGIIDPALYYGHNEMELAYMTLFGSVGQVFFDTYTQVIPVDTAFFEVRRHVYNLYPLLVHVTIFGKKYNHLVDSTLNTFGF